MRNKKTRARIEGSLSFYSCSLCSLSGFQNFRSVGDPFCIDCKVLRAFLDHGIEVVSLRVFLIEIPALDLIAGLLAGHVLEPACGNFQLLAVIDRDGVRLGVNITVNGDLDARLFLGRCLRERAARRFRVALVADEVDLVIILGLGRQTVKGSREFLCFRIVGSRLGHELAGEISGSGKHDGAILDLCVVQNVDLTCDGDRIVRDRVEGSGDEGSEVLSAAPIDPMRVSIKNVLNATKNTCWKRKKVVTCKFISVMPDYGRE